MIKLSIIMPTRNRAEFLRDALESIRKQTLEQSFFEVIVCDNNSTDKTAEIAKSFAGKFQNFKYVKTLEPGLHVGRNLGLQMAQADIISYLDDDVIVHPEWAEAVIDRFEMDQNVVLVGGPCRPLWESERPGWLNRFIINNHDVWILSELSLIDLGEKPKIMSAKDVYGCNFSIRRKILLDLGGFHPDGMPTELLKYRGDGESGLAKVIDENDMQTFYEPKATIMHRVPENRTTREYFSGIARRGAYEEAYAKYRNLHNARLISILKEIVARIKQALVATSDKLFQKNNRTEELWFTPMDYWFTARWYGLFHFLRILTSPKLKKWVIQDTYFKEDWCPYAITDKNKGFVKNDFENKKLMKITNSRIVVVLYNYPLGVSTMLINTIEMLREGGNEVAIISNSNQSKYLPCESWLNNLFVPVFHEGIINKIEKMIIDNKFLYIFARIIKNKALPIFARKKLVETLTWEQKNYGIFDFAKVLGTYLANNKVDVVMSVECFSLISTDIALTQIKSKPKSIYFDMELLDWSLDNPLYSDKLELKQRQFDALKQVNHVVITSNNRAKIFAKINQFPEEYISVLPVVPRAREIKVRSNYFRKKFNIPDNKVIVLYSGNFMPWAQCVEIIKSVKNWPPNVELVMHTWNRNILNSDYFKEMKHVAVGLPVHFSSDYLVYKELCLALSSADIGLVYYAEIDDNFTEICFSSNKMGEYLASGMPVICSPFPSLKEFVDEQGIGFSVSFEKIGYAIDEILKDQKLYRRRVKECCKEYFVFDRYYNDAFQNMKNVIKNNNN